MAIIALREQQITVYDSKGWILRAPVSSGQKGRETPAGVFSVLEKEAEHYSNMYDDAYMPHMQRLTWSGIAAGQARSFELCILARDEVALRWLSAAS
jgi:L,D-transpeptidase catalytic domain